MYFSVIVLDEKKICPSYRVITTADPIRSAPSICGFWDSYFYHIEDFFYILEFYVLVLRNADYK